MVRVFCDFDGTVSPIDIGNRFFRTYVGELANEIVKGYLDGTATARECLTRECAAVKNVTAAEFESFLEQFSLDPYFKGFVDFCNEREIPLAILSDGLDFYVGRILARHGLGRLPWYANHLEFVTTAGGTSLEVSFPYADAECDYCGNCKRNHMLTQSADEDVVVYVGDGISDRCPVRFADIVFAKRSLIKYCQEQNISYHAFDDFREVHARLAEILQHKPKRRREAVMARREVFMQG
ncbi:MAG: HAD-IB family phosphatase [Bacteroidota bacterium]